MDKDLKYWILASTMTVTNATMIGFLTMMYLIVEAASQR